MAKDINRIKVVLAEKNGQINGWQRHWVKIQLLFPSGVQTLLSQDLKLCFK